MQSAIFFVFPSILVSRVMHTCRYGACCPRDIQLFLAGILVIHLQKIVPTGAMRAIIQIVEE